MSMKIKYDGSYYTPRINFTVAPETLRRSQNVFSQNSGLRGIILNKIFLWLLIEVEKHGEAAVAEKIARAKTFPDAVRELAERA